MTSRWKEVGSWNVGTADGGSEKYSLSENKDTGNFRIKNEFGNITIDMERMSGHKFLKKVLKKMEEIISPGVDYDDDLWAKSLGLDFDGDDSNDNDYSDCDYTD